MKKKLPKKIVVTGPESSGKTLLAESLAQALGVRWSPEFARYYVGHLGRAYRQSDLKPIARGQMLWEQWYLAQAGEMLICDTDWTVLQVWENYRFGHQTHAYWQQGYGKPIAAELYLLCAPDFPWQPDPLREHPTEREALFECYRQLLQETAVPFFILQGDNETRLKNALLQVRNL